METHNFFIQSAMSTEQEEEQKDDSKYQPSGLTMEKIR